MPNFATNAKQFENFYDSDDRPSNEDIDKFGAGLIGFRERSYLSDLNVDSGTQLKFYQGLLKQKGTLNSIQALTTATFSNLGGNLDLYEEWAIRVGEYGALDINQFFEIDDILYSMMSYEKQQLADELYDSGYCPKQVKEVMDEDLFE